MHSTVSLKANLNKRGSLGVSLVLTKTYLTLPRTMKRIRKSFNCTPRLLRLANQIRMLQWT